MKNFYHYLAESEKTYKYRVKTLIEADNDFLDRLEKALAKYDLADVSKPKKTIVQNYPRDFRDVEHGEVYIIDIVTRIPASSAVLHQELVAAFECAHRFLVVRGENEPAELESEKLVQDIEDASDDREKVALLSDAEYGEVAEKEPEQDFGDAYNKRLLNYLATVTAENEKLEVKPVEGEKLFNWLKAHEKGEDFNKDIDTPKPVHRNDAKKSAKDPTRVGSQKN